VDPGVDQRRATYDDTGPHAWACLQDVAMKAKLPLPAQVEAAPGDATPTHLLLFPFTHQPQLLASAHAAHDSTMTMS
jgi:hypothetical protein